MHWYRPFDPPVTFFIHPQSYIILARKKVDKAYQIAMLLYFVVMSNV